MKAKKQIERLEDFVSSSAPYGRFDDECTVDYTLRILFEYREAFREIEIVCDDYATRPDGLAMGRVYLLAKQALNHFWP